VARVELSVEARAIETLIDKGQRDLASARLRAACAYFGRRPEYRYLLCFFDSRFRVRSDAELLREVTELVGDQPELFEATALLAELHARAGDEARADLFARMALESKNPSARARAMEVLTSQAEESVTSLQRSSPVPLVGSPVPGDENAPSSDILAMRAWFERAGRELIHRRTPGYGVRPFHSMVEMLLDWGRTVAEGHSFLSAEPLKLTRESLAIIDEVVVAQRRQLARRAASPTDASPIMAIAGFFLAVVLHELEAGVLEISPDDGGCKVLLPSGAGVRPLLIATGYADGSGPSLAATFDRLAAARELASGPPSSPSVHRVSSARMAAAAARSSGAPKPMAASALARAELALNRPDVETVPLRVLARPTWPADLPPFDLPGIAAALASSQSGQEIAERSGAFLSATPASIEALESYCLATRGGEGAAAGAGPWHPSDADEELILAWGALLGETLIAAYGGVWECDPNAPSDPRLFRVICQERVASWPVTQVYLRLKDGGRHNLIEFVAAVGRLLD
jgi:hypothetical protein